MVSGKGIRNATQAGLGGLQDAHREGKADPELLPPGQGQGPEDREQ
jgi:hypothetical protein